MSRLDDHQQATRRAMRSKACSTCKKPIIFLYRMGRPVPVDAATVGDDDVKFDGKRHRFHSHGARVVRAPRRCPGSMGERCSNLAVERGDGEPPLCEGCYRRESDLL